MEGKHTVRPSFQHVFFSFELRQRLLSQEEIPTLQQKATPDLEPWPRLTTRAAMV